MDVSESRLKIEQFERQVMWRKRILALQDRLGIAVLAGGMLAAGLVLYIRLRPLTISAGAIASAVLIVALLAAALFWFFARASVRDAAFHIDDKLDLEDRLATSRAIIERGGPRSDFETGLIEDAASRVKDHKAAEVTPYQLSGWPVLSLLGVAALIAALMVPQKAIPVSPEVLEARSDIQSAGQLLEQSAAEIEPTVPPESETAELAKQQAELGRALRLSPESRAEALKKLSALEERIRRRHDELASTGADEIVSAADQRLRAALSPKPTDRKSKTALDQSNTMKETDGSASDRATKAQDKSTPRNSPGKNQKTDQQQNTQPNTQQSANNKSETQPPDKGESQRKPGKSQPPNRPQEPVSSQNQMAGSQANQKTAKQGAEQTNQNPQQASQTSQQPEQPAPASDSENQPSGAQPSNPITGAIAEQAAKALPSVSGELMKKAAELRAGQLKPEDIRNLAEAAKFLANDLSKIARSKEFQSVVEELAKQITPEQIEAVARELAKNEQLVRELQATARMLLENQQAKQVVADLAEQFQKMGEQFGPRGGTGGDISQDGERERGGRNRGGPNNGGPGQPEQTSGKPVTPREVDLGGKIQRKDGGQYLYLQSKAGAGAARAPYSSAYPQYRREAERSVERSSVPPHLRTTVRRYFDAINPDQKKQQ